MAVFNSSESTLFCEPSLARKSKRPADLVLLDPEIGVHVFEVKYLALEQISVDPGGTFRVRRGSRVDTRNPIVQVRNAMFDIKDAAAHALGGDMRIPFEYWVVFPSFTRAAWMQRFGNDAFSPPEFLFADDLIVARLQKYLRATERAGSNDPIRVCSLEQLQVVHRAFGDTLVLYTPAGEREERSTRQGTLGALFDKLAAGDKFLSEEQQRLSELKFDGGPRQVRGVAGSGKTVVLANNLARFLQRRLTDNREGLFGPSAPQPRMLAVCFNRTLAPYLHKKISQAYLQRTGNPLPIGCVDVCHFNNLMYRLGRAGLWRYRSVETPADIVGALNYLKDLEATKRTRPAAIWENSYDAVYVDEGQDFFEEEYRLLIQFCRTPDGGEPNLFVFYDDAQNLYGRARPNWRSLGLNVRGGRSFIMTRCFRNTRQILEPAFNVLYGSCAPPRSEVPTKEFGAIASLES